MPSPFTAELVILARERNRLLEEVLAELRGQPTAGWSGLPLADDGLPDTPGLDDAIGVAFHALGIERVGGRVAAVTLAVRRYLGTLKIGGLS